MPPSLAAINIHEQCCIQRDVVSFHAGAAMQQAVGANHLGTGVAQDSELAVHNSIPDKQGVLAVVNADGYNTRVERVEFFSMPRELAQLACAVRSPVSAIEDQKHAFATHCSKANALSMLVLKRKIRRLLALGGIDLGPRQDLLRGAKRRKEQKDDNSRSRCSEHNTELYRSL